MDKIGKFGFIYTAVLVDGRGAAFVHAFEGSWLPETAFGSGRLYVLILDAKILTAQ